MKKARERICYSSWLLNHLIVTAYVMQLFVDWFSFYVKLQTRYPYFKADYMQEEYTSKCDNVGKRHFFLICSAPTNIEALLR